MRTTYRFLKLEDVAQQLIGDGVVSESEVDDHNVSRRLVRQHWTSELRRHVQTKPISYSDLVVADPRSPLALVQRQLSDKP